MKRLMLMFAAFAAPALAEDTSYETLVPGESGQVRLAYEIAPSGYVENCTVEQSSGFPRLDAASCRMMVLKTRFAPMTERTRATKSIRWVAGEPRSRRTAGAQPHPFGAGEGTPNDWASLNPGWVQSGSN